MPIVRQVTYFQKACSLHLRPRHRWLRPEMRRGWDMNWMKVRWKKTGRLAVHTKLRRASDETTTGNIYSMSVDLNSKRHVRLNIAYLIKLKRT